ALPRLRTSREPRQKLFVAAANGKAVAGRRRGETQSFAVRVIGTVRYLHYIEVLRQPRRLVGVVHPEDRPDNFLEHGLITLHFAEQRMLWIAHAPYMPEMFDLVVNSRRQWINTQLT